MHESETSPQPVDSVFDKPVSQDALIASQINSLLHRESFRKKVTEVIIDHTDSVPFMKKVQGYADEEIDKRLFKNTKVVAGVIIGWIVTAAIAYIAAKYGA